MSAHRLRGFTLIEILSAFAIVAILALLIFPLVSSVRNRALSAECVSDARQIGIGMRMYAADHNNELPKHSYSPRQEAAIAIGRYLFPDIESGDDVLDQVSENLSCPVSGWGYGFNTFISGKSINAIGDTSKVIYMCDLYSGGRWLDAHVLTWKTKDLIKATPKPHEHQITVLYVDGHVELEKVSDLTRGQVRNVEDDTPIGDPDYD
ncbi:type II secretion system protein [Coraliomargarita parva]|uniref:type II secretion system protein n=1 Tax=Coraliomargarita parva TaxID=3014050 RepID=UPI0022B2F95A|nr:type II secretion system protein [Coraliomargarita parva]